MPTTASGLDRNRLLAGLPQRERTRFLDSSLAVELTLTEVLVGIGNPIRHAYFPLESCISLSAPGAGDAALDIGCIGNEGMLGIGLVLGVEVSAQVAVVRGTGPALRMHAALFRHELLACPVLARILKRYVHVRMAQLAQTAICTRFHVVEARLARLLLMTQDRAHTRSIHITHETLASRLGVRRAGITIAASSLQRRALIAYHRGEVTILDRNGLKSAACSCYAADNETYARAMGASPTRRLANRRTSPAH